MTQSAKNFGDAEWDEARARFLERQSARHLAEDAGARTDDASLISATRKALAGEISPHELLKVRPGAALPFGVAAIARALMAQRSLAFSAVARAASTHVLGPREVGPYLVEFAEEQDAVFLMVSCRSQLAPKLFQGLTETGLFVEIELPDPVDDIVQTGIAKAAPIFEDLLTVLKDPGSSFFLI